MKQMTELYIESIFSIFYSIFFYSWHSSGIFLIWPVSMIPWLLHWIIFWIESPKFILNGISVWIEFWRCTIESNQIELNNFLPEFKHWIESVSLWLMWMDCKIKTQLIYTSAKWKIWNISDALQRVSAIYDKIKLKNTF